MRTFNVAIDIEPPDGLPPIWPGKFLTAVANGTSFAHAATAAGIEPVVARKHLDSSPAFENAWRWCIDASQMPPRDLLAALAEHAVDQAGRDRLADLAAKAV